MYSIDVANSSGVEVLEAFNNFQKYNAVEDCQALLQQWNALFYKQCKEAHNAVIAADKVYFAAVAEYHSANNEFKSGNGTVLYETVCKLYDAQRLAYADVLKCEALESAAQQRLRAVEGILIELED